MEVTTAAPSAFSMVEVASEPRPVRSEQRESTERASTTRQLAVEVEAPRAEVEAEAPALTYLHSERMALVLRTQEGDVVRLRFSTRDAVRIHRDYAATHTLELVQAEGREPTIGLRSASSLMVKVEGELNADELAAVQDAVDRATGLAQEFFEGGVDSAFEAAAALEIDSEHLVKLSFKASFKERLTYSPALSSEPTVAELLPAAVDGERMPSEADAETPQEVLAAPAVEVEAPVEESAVVGDLEVEALSALDDRGEPAVEAAAEAAGDEAAPEATGAPEAPDPMAVLADFFRSLSERLGFGVRAQDGAMLDVSLKVRMFESVLVTMAEARTEEPALPSLVTDTLAAMTAPEPAPLDEVA